MEREEYIFKKLGNLSPMNKTLADEIVKELGEWATINEVAKYFNLYKEPDFFTGINNWYNGILNYFFQKEYHILWKK